MAFNKVLTVLKKWQTPEMFWLLPSVKRGDYIYAACLKLGLNLPLHYTIWKSDDGSWNINNQFKYN